MKRFIYFLLALLGVTGCDPNSGSDARVEYGTPHVNFHLMARVVDSEGNPIKGITVTTERGEKFYANTGTSNAEGLIDANGAFWPGDQNVVIFQDVDGELNGGEFETLQLDISSSVELVRDGESWCMGDYKAELGDVYMTLKGTESTEPEEPEEPADPEEPAKAEE